MEQRKTLYQDKLIIANCSGFLGDRFTAAKEMVRGGPIDFLTGDYLAELTMAILFRKTLKDPSAGYATTFLRQMEEIMGECLDKNIRVATNAGGLNPKSLAQKLEEIANKLGLKPKIAYIEGDNLIGRLDELREKGENFTHLDKGIPLKEAKAYPVSANAYLGGWGIAAALEKGADIVVGGRLADAALVVGPAAWKFQWRKDDWDRLAGAVAAGHIIECGAQATGGNYSFIEEVPSFNQVGFPMAEIHEDGSFVISKHPGTGGLISPGTVTAQLLYEIRTPQYLTPDVTAHFETADISLQAEDRTIVKGVKGSPPPSTTKVCLNNLAGHRNSVTVVLTGLDIERKAKIMEDTLFQSLGGKEQFEKVKIQLVRSDKPDPQTNEEAFAHLRISVVDQDPKKAGRLFSSKAVELALANIPGFTMTAPPGNGGPLIAHWPALISRSNIEEVVSIGGERIIIEPAPETADEASLSDRFDPVKIDAPDLTAAPTTKAPFGRAFAARSGDKGGNANLGVWGSSAEGFAFLREFLSVKKLKELLPDIKSYEIERYELPNLRALNFYIKGILGEGVAASFRSDPQAKTLGEYLRARIVEMPESIIRKNP